MNDAGTLASWVRYLALLAASASCAGSSGDGSVGGANTPFTPSHQEARTHPPSEAKQEDATSEAPAPAQSGAFETLETREGDAILWIPPGGARKPLLLVAHGAGGAPEWHCDYWARVVTRHAFVLCVRGKAIRSGEHAFFFPEHYDLGRRLRAALDAFDTEHGERRDPETVYVAYSQGATMGALALPELAEVLSLALLIEGGYEQWPVASARRFAKAGGRRVYFACGTGSCRRGAERSVRWLAQAGLEADMGARDGAGHTPGGEVGESAQAGLRWLVRDSDAFSAFVSCGSDGC